jgi:hypothetical protein
MEFFEFNEIISTMAYLSLGFIAVEIYLSINKLWKRKHEKIVAESISIGAKLISLIPVTVFTIDFALSQKWASFTSYLLFIFSVLMQIAIGSGLWVAGGRKKGFWTLFGQSLEQESKEIGDLAKSLFSPNHADKIIEILVRAANIDEVLDKREKEFIQSFAENWNIAFSWDHFKVLDSEKHLNLDQIRQCVLDYLDTHPPVNQAKQLLDVLNMLVKIDDEVSSKEEMMMEEIEGLIGHYVNQTDENADFHVAIVPQNEQQETAIVSLLPKAVKRQVAGGHAYLIGPFYSQKYAEIVCDRYRAFEFFSVSLLSELTEKKMDEVSL